MDFNQTAQSTGFAELAQPLRESATIADAVNTASGFAQKARGLKAKAEQNRVEGFLAGQALDSLQDDRRFISQSFVDEDKISAEDASVITNGGEEALETLNRLEASGQGNPVLLEVKRNIARARLIRENPGRAAALLRAGGSGAIGGRLKGVRDEEEKRRQAEINLKERRAFDLGIDLEGVSRDDIPSVVDRHPLSHTDRINKELAALNEQTSARKEFNVPVRNQQKNLGLGQVLKGVADFKERQQHLLLTDPSRYSALEATQELEQQRFEYSQFLLNIYHDDPKAVTESLQEFDEILEAIVPSLDGTDLGKQVELEHTVRVKRPAIKYQESQAARSEQLSIAQLEEQLLRTGQARLDHDQAGIKEFFSQLRTATSILEDNQGLAQSEGKSAVKKTVEAERLRLIEAGPEAFAEISKVRTGEDFSITGILGPNDTSSNKYPLGKKVGDHIIGAFNGTINLDGESPVQYVENLLTGTYKHVQGQPTGTELAAAMIAAGEKDPNLKEQLFNSKKIKVMVPEFQRLSRKQIATNHFEPLAKVLEEESFQINRLPKLLGAIKPGSLVANAVNSLSNVDIHNLTEVDFEHLNKTGDIRLIPKTGIHEVLEGGDIQRLGDHLIRINNDTKGVYKAGLDAIIKLDGLDTYEQALVALGSTSSRFSDIFETVPGSQGISLAGQLLGVGNQKALLPAAGSALSETIQRLQAPADRIRAEQLKKDKVIADKVRAKIIGKSPDTNQVVTFTETVIPQAQEVTSPDGPGGILSDDIAEEQVLSQEIPQNPITTSNTADVEEALRSRPAPKPQTEVDGEQEVLSQDVEPTILDTTRDQIPGFKSIPGNRYISGDFNAASSDAQGFEIIIPSDSTAEERNAAEEYVLALDSFFQSHGIPRPNRGVKVSGKGQRGVKGVIHTEPFFAKDTEARRVIEENAEEYALIMKTTLGAIPGANFIPPHKSTDGGAETPDGVNERDFFTGVILPNLRKV